MALFCFCFFSKMLRFYLQSFLVVQKVKMLLQSQCNWQPRTDDSPITAIHSTAGVLHENLTTLTNLLGWSPQAWWWISRGTKWRKVECHRNYSLALWVGGCAGVSISHSLTSSQLTLPPPHVLKTILYVCIFIPVLSLSSSEPFFFFQIPYICVSIRYLFFSFWLTSLCMTDSRSIHLTTNNSISFIFMTQ